MENSKIAQDEPPASQPAASPLQRDLSIFLQATEPIVVIFLAARIVEHAVADRFRSLIRQHEPGQSSIHIYGVDAQLQTLHFLGDLPDRFHAALHEIRRLGNDARHTLEHPSLEDAEYVRRLLLLVAKNSAVFSALASRLGNLADSNQSFDHPGAHEVALGEAFADAIAAENVNAKELLSLMAAVAGRRANGVPLPWFVPTALTLCADRIRKAGHPKDCLTLLDEADRCERHCRHVAPKTVTGRKFPPRVDERQRIRALALKRVNGLLEAKKYLLKHCAAANYTSDSGQITATRISTYGTFDYVETLGILAGMYKDEWLAQKATGASTSLCPLEVSKQLYTAAHKSQPWNFYIALNLCATTAWLCAGSCQGVETASHQRQAAVDLVGRLFKFGVCVDHISTFDPYAGLTLAEALLLANQVELAINVYQAWRRSFSTDYDAIWVRAKEQLQIHMSFGFLTDAQLKKLTD